MKSKSPKRTCAYIWFRAYLLSFFSRSLPLCFPPRDGESRSALPRRGYPLSKFARGIGGVDENATFLEAASPNEREFWPIFQSPKAAHRKTPAKRFGRRTDRRRLAPCVAAFEHHRITVGAFVSFNRLGLMYRTAIRPIDSLNAAFSGPTRRNLQTQQKIKSSLF